MAVALRPWAAQLLYVWFHQLDPEDWWGGSDAVDAMLRRCFARDLKVMATRLASEFLTEPRTAQAAILLFDQVSRNIHRGTPGAFAADPLARALTHGMILGGCDRRIPKRERLFVYMPLMHSENIADQRASLKIFAREEPEQLGFARSHHRMIARFGRFPHRNAVLGRRSSSAEKAAVAAGFSW